MKLLTATTATQGHRAGDFFWCVEGELVVRGDVCDRDRDDPDDREDGCGCGWSFGGLNSGRATTTAKVAEVPLGRGEVVEAIRGLMDRTGWPVDAVEALADDVIATAGRFPVGAVVEVCDGVVVSRG